MKISPEELDGCVNNRLGFLDAFGYQYEKAHVENLVLVGPYLRCSYGNPRLGINLTIDLIYSSKPEMRDVIVFFLSSGKGSFSLAGYLKHAGANESRVREIEWPEQGIDKAISAAAELLQTDLRSVIAGSEWKDVPFDWCGYK